MRFILGTAFALALAATPALADSISPSSYSTTLDLGQSVTINKTVTVTAGTPTEALVDIFFLSDTTGSMGGFIDTVVNNANDILTGTAGLGDVAWGVGEYKDFPTSPWGDPGDFPFRLNTAITTTQADVNTGLAQWGASGGNDLPESNLYALQQTAIDPAVGWRDGSSRFVIWFGDAEGHDPATTAGYPGPGLATTITALTGLNATVFAFGEPALDGTGQATAITGATGGTLFLGGNPGSDIVDLIQAAIEETFETYSTVALSPFGNLPGVGVVTSGPIVGAFDRSIARSFEFDVTFTGLELGVHDFEVRALVDGAIVAVEEDVITVVPEPATWAMLITGFGLVGFAARRRRMAVAG